MLVHAITSFVNDKTNAYSNTAENVTFHLEWNWIKENITYVLPLEHNEINQDEKYCANVCVKIA